MQYLIYISEGCRHRMSGALDSTHQIGHNIKDVVHDFLQKQCHAYPQVVSGIGTQLPGSEWS